MVIFLFLGFFNNRLVHEVFVSRLEIAVEICHAQHMLGSLAVNVEVILKHNVVFCKRSSLIGKKNIHRSKVLDGIKIFDNRLLFAHQYGAFCEARSHDHR